jgi:hypothetical protein
MSAWSNIHVATDDAEIQKINELEKILGGIPDQVGQIRELITRFEVCHFKQEQHLENIRKSIEELRPHTDPGTIGKNHIQHGDKAWESDKTGRSFLGQQYLWALNNWLDDNKMVKPSEYNDQLGREVMTLLGEKSAAKENLVRLLIARLTWDWKKLEELSQQTLEEISAEADENRLEYQICRMDICHFAFPVNLIYVIRGIGEMRPVERFEGCGTHNQVIRKTMQAELTRINNWLSAREDDGLTECDTEEQTRIWLLACLAKTIKEQSRLKAKVVIPVL